MRPIVYHKDDFPIELSRTQRYIDFSVSWNDGFQKFCVRTGRCTGWRYDVTTSGAYDTFAEAYAAAEEKASDLAAARDAYNDVCLLHPEDNRKSLQGSWGLSKEQSAELSHTADTLQSKPPIDVQISEALKRTASAPTPTQKDKSIKR